MSWFLVPNFEQVVETRHTFVELHLLFVILVLKKKNVQLRVPSPFEV